MLSIDAVPALQIWFSHARRKAKKQQQQAEGGGAAASPGGAAEAAAHSPAAGQHPMPDQQQAAQHAQHPAVAQAAANGALMHQHSGSPGRADYPHGGGASAPASATPPVCEAVCSIDICSCLRLNGTLFRQRSRLSTETVHTVKCMMVQTLRGHDRSNDA